MQNHLKKFLDSCICLFPISTSVIPLYIIACVIASNGRNNPLTLKVLYESLPFYSDAGIKNNLQELISDGYIEIRQSPLDKRVKNLHSTNKLDTIYQEFLRQSVKDWIQS